MSGLVELCQSERLDWLTTFDCGSDPTRIRDARLSHLEDWVRQRGENRRVLGAFGKAWEVTPRSVRRDLKVVNARFAAWARRSVADPEAQRTRIFQSLDECADAAFEAGEFKTAVAARMAQAKMLGLDKSVLEVRATAAEPLTPEQMREQFAQLPPAVRHAMIRDLSAVDDGVITLPDADVRRIG